MDCFKLDKWAQWLLHRRHGGDAEQLRQTLEFLYPIRDRVLDNAAVAMGDTLLDVGCGDGLIAFGACERVGDRGTVIFSDISQDLLDHARRLVAEGEEGCRCQFVHAAAEDLAVIGDGTIDSVTTRSVLIYVAEKQRAFAEFFRVLRPGGRLSIYEPINRFAMRSAWEDAPIADLRARLLAIYEAIQPPESDPMLDFDERDLLALAEGAGFREIHLDYQAEISPSEPRSWESVLHSSGNPNIPTLAEAMAQAFTPEERERYEAYVRPLVEGGQRITHGASSYLWAVKG